MRILGILIRRLHTFLIKARWGFPGSSAGKESACKAGNLGWEATLEEGMVGHSSILAWRIRMDREAWQATVHGVAKSRT